MPRDWISRYLKVTTNSLKTVRSAGSGCSWEEIQSGSPPRDRHELTCALIYLRSQIADCRSTKTVFGIVLRGGARGKIPITPVLFLAGGANARHVTQNKRLCLCERVHVDTKKRQQIWQLISRMRPLTDKSIKIHGLNVQFARDFCKLSTIKLSYFADSPPSPAPIAEGLNKLVDDAISLAHPPSPLRCYP